jgi:hypothetical protein
MSTDLHWLFGDVDVGKLQELVVPGGQPAPDVVGVATGAIQLRAAVYQMAAQVGSGNSRHPHPCRGSGKAARGLHQT